jgi:hypothetical protein
MGTLEGIDVCLVAWNTILDVFRTTYYQWKKIASNGMRANQHRNLGTKKPYLVGNCNIVSYARIVS